MSWNNTVIAVVAGDAREQEIGRCAIRAGATVRAYGFPWPDEGIEGVYHAKDAADALKGADIALFPGCRGGRTASLMPAKTWLICSISPM